MASIQQRGDKWRAVVRKAGYPTTVQTFDTKTEARQWAKRTEADIESGVLLARKRQSQKKTTFGDLIDRYIEEVHPLNNFCESKIATYRLTQRDIGHYKLHEITIEKVLDYGRQRRLGTDDRKGVARSTLNTQLQYMAELVEFARISWGMPFETNPVRDARYALAKMKLVGPSRKRARRLASGEYEKLMEASKGHWISHFIVIAVHNAMRLGEIHRQTWEDVDFENRTLTIRDRKDPHEKEGNDETIPMLHETWTLLHGLWLCSKQRGRVFCQVATAGAVSDKFADVAQLAGCPDLRFHDLRHEACSRLFEQGLSIEQVALVSGHKSWDTLKRYTQLKPGEVLAVIEGN